MDTVKDYSPMTTTPYVTPQPVNMEETFASQIYDGMTGMASYRSLMFNEFTRQKTEEELESIRSYYVNMMKADIAKEQSEGLTWLGRFASGFEADWKERDINSTALELMNAREKNDQEEIERLTQDLAVLKHEYEIMAKPEEQGPWSIYNVGKQTGETIGPLALEFGLTAAEWATEGLTAAAGGAVAAAAAGATGPAGAASVITGTNALITAEKAAFWAGKKYLLWDMFYNREAGSLYYAIMDDPAFTEEQRRAMAKSYGQVAATVELGGYSLGSAALLKMGGKEVSSTVAGTIIRKGGQTALTRWAAKNVLVKKLAETAGKETAKQTTKQFIKKTAARVGGAAAAEATEEMIQTAAEQETKALAKAGKTPDVVDIAVGAYGRMADLIMGIPRALIEQRLSPEAAEILAAGEATILPSLLFGLVGVGTSAVSRSMNNKTPQNSGEPSNYSLTTGNFRSAFNSAERNYKRIGAILDFAKSAKDKGFVKTWLETLVKNGELEDTLYLSSEDASVLLALSESSPTIKNVLAKTGIRKAIQDGQKTGTVALPTVALSDVITDSDFIGSDASKAMQKSLSTSESETTMSSLNRQLKKETKARAEKVIKEASSALKRKVKGLKRQFTGAGFTEEEANAKIDVFLSALSTISEASNGKKKIDKMINDFLFLIERRNFDIRGDVSKAIGEIVGDTRPLLGSYTRKLKKSERDGKPLSKAQAKKTIVDPVVESITSNVAADNAVFDAIRIVAGDNKNVKNVVKKLVDGDVATYNEVSALMPKKKGKGPSDLDNFIIGLRDAIEVMEVSGGLDADDAIDALRTATVFAGSPVDYIAPMLSAIGTGEGHFAHGWGLYYAVHLSVANGYRQRYEERGFTELRYAGKRIQDAITAIKNKITKKDQIPMSQYTNKDKQYAAEVEFVSVTGGLLHKNGFISNNHVNKFFKAYTKAQLELLEAKKAGNPTKALEKKAAAAKRDFEKAKNNDMVATMKTDIAATKAEVINNIEEKIELLKSAISNSQRRLDDYKSDTPHVVVTKNFTLEDLIVAEEERLNNLKAQLEVENLALKKANQAKSYAGFTYEQRFAPKTGQLKKFTLRKIDTFMREDVKIGEQNKLIRDAVKNVVKKTGTDKFFFKQDSVERYIEFRTVRQVMFDIYNSIAMQKYDQEFDELSDAQRNAIKKEVALMLREEGVNGISYYGGKDKECFVVFTPSLLRVKESYFDAIGKGEGTAEEQFMYDLFDEEAGLTGPKELYVAQHADMTTFEHEMMHFITRGLIELYNENAISDEWRKQVDALYDYFHDVIVPNTRDRRAMRKDRSGKIIMDKEASETLSTQFQVYLETGKANTPTMERFYAFMKNLSADLFKALSRGYYRDRELSDTLVNFYDRVLQTHIDIENTEYQFGYSPLDQMDGVSDEEYRKYKLERAVVRSRTSNDLFQSQRNMVKNRQKARWKEIFQQKFEEIKEKLQQRLEYIVVDYVTNNGLVNYESMAMAVKNVNDIPDKYISTNGKITAQQLAEKFGPDVSLADIAGMLINTKDINLAAQELAKQEADSEYMNETDPMSDTAPANALRTIGFVKVLLKESFMIKGRPLSEFEAFWKDWIIEMENYVMNMTVRNITDLGKWADEESRLTDDFMAAFNGGDVQTASLKAEQRAAVNYILARSKQISREQRAFQRKFKKFKSAPTTAQSKKIDGITWNLIHEIMRLYGMTVRAGRIPGTALEQFDDWIANREGNEFLPIQFLKDQRMLLMHGIKPSSLTVNQFEQISDLLNVLNQIGEAEQQVFTEERAQRLDVVAGEIITNVVELNRKGKLKAFCKDTLAGMSTSMTPMMGVLEAVFGKLGMNELYMQLREALVARDNLQENIKKIISDSFKRNNIAAIMADKREFKIGERTVNNEILLFALEHSGNKHNRENAIVTLQQYYKDDSFSEEEYNAFLEATPAGMRAYVNDLWAMFKQVKELIDKQSYSASRTVIGTVEAEPYKLSDGTVMNGGYFPAPKLNKISNVEDLEAYMNPNLFFPTMGIAKDRIKNREGYLDMSQRSLMRWIYQATTLATLQKPFNDMMVVLNHPELKSLFNSVEYGSELRNYISDFTKTVVQPQMPVPRLLRNIQRAPTMVYMGFRAASGFVQLLGILPAVTEVNPVLLAKHATNILNLPRYFKIKKEMSKRSAIMADRARNFDSGFFGLFRDESDFMKASRKFGDGFMETCMTFVRTFQEMTDLIVWDAKHEEAINAGMTEEEAVREADKAVLKTQGDRTPINTPEAFRNAYAKFFQPFMTYILTLKQMGASYRMASDYKKLGALLAMIVLSNLIEAYIKEEDKEWRRKLLGKKTKGSSRDFNTRVENRFLAQTVSTLGGIAIPFAGIGSAVSGVLSEEFLKEMFPGYRSYTEGSTAAVEVLTTAAKAISLDKTAMKKVYDEDMDLWANLVDFLL